MWNGAHVLVVALSLLAGPYVAAKKYYISVGYLPCIKSEFRYMQGLSISGAISMALDEINNSTEILPDVTLLLQWADTHCDKLKTTRLFTEMICTWAVAFFGPEEQCEIPAFIAQSRNLPLISHKCSDDQINTSPNFVRMDPAVKKVTKSVVSLLRYYRWNKFSILYEKAYFKAALSLEHHAKLTKMSLNHLRLVDDSWSQIIQDTKSQTRIYVFFGSTPALVDMMNAMESMQLFARGEYMVIFIDMIPLWPKDPLDYLLTKDRLVCPKNQFKKRAQSLMVVVSSPPWSNYENFARKVHEYSSMKPFQFPDPFLGNTFFSIHAAYLYDSVKLYATALHNLIEEETVQKNETLNFNKLMSIATDGSRIVSKMLALTPFNSIMGSLIRFDEEQNTEGNYTVLAYRASSFGDVSMTNFRSDFNCSHSMIPVGRFLERGSSNFPSYAMNLRVPVDWPGMEKPEDEPACGYSNDKC
ncbi:receptor-type guanylate cyclase Gyc76C-like [Epargyreus clarus]|uniref:receptor-type guanylate cyclase Gyc76C-like n=1 Tax=Epargyreus clarus TaxID=520877 RepID=UPI003C2F7B84